MGTTIFKYLATRSLRKLRQVQPPQYLAWNFFTPKQKAHKKASWNHSVVAVASGAPGKPKPANVPFTVNTGNESSPAGLEGGSVRAFGEGVRGWCGVGGDVWGEGWRGDDGWLATGTLTSLPLPAQTHVHPQRKRATTFRQNGETAQTTASASGSGRGSPALKRSPDDSRGRAQPSLQALRPIRHGPGA
jgi:hypothetical protein